MPVVVHSQLPWILWYSYSYVSSLLWIFFRSALPWCSNISLLVNPSLLQRLNRVSEVWRGSCLRLLMFNLLDRAYDSTPCNFAVISGTTELHEEIRLWVWFCSGISLSTSGGQKIHQVSTKWRASIFSLYCNRHKWSLWLGMSCALFGFLWPT